MPSRTGPATTLPIAISRSCTSLALSWRSPRCPVAKADQYPVHHRIYQLEKSIHQSNAQNGDAESRPLISSEDPELVFKRALDVELEKISSFYQLKEQELIDETNNLLRDVGTFEEEGGEAEQEQQQQQQEDARPMTRSSSGPARQQARIRRESAASQHSTEDGVEDSDEEADGDETTALTAPITRKRRVSLLGRRKTTGPATDMTASTEFTRSMRRPSTQVDDYEQAVVFSSGIMLKKRIVSLYVQLCELKSYVQLNKTGFRKVLKKFDKILDLKYRPVYMSKYVEPAYPFQDETMRGLEDNIRKMEESYTDIVTNGDFEAAKKDLRSHLREHVVWERNTVWRDLIGIERRAEAASLGQTLLGTGGKPSKTRLQGDDEQNPDIKLISTPIGRFTCPTWLFSSGMFFLLASVAVFLTLLLIPIMEKPEQQNCLAMLVFVSLLWATEVSRSVVLYVNGTVTDLCV